MMPGEIERLREHLNNRESRPEDWYRSLNERKRKELEFHNKHRDLSQIEQLPQDTYELLYGNKKYYRTTQISQEYIHNWIKKEVKGKVFLDYACGNGQFALMGAECGAGLAIGLDISDVSIKNATKKAAERGLSSNTVFIQGDCENTLLPDNSIDVIFCGGMLHHLDLSYAFPELRRILKPGGKVFAGEALDYSPIIKLYRMLTPEMRTDWEKTHILSLKDLRFAKHFFKVTDVRYWHLFSIAAVPFFRWSIVFNFVLKLGNFLDRFLLRLPAIQLLAWQFTFVLTKPQENEHI